MNARHRERISVIQPTPRYYWREAVFIYNFPPAYPGIINPMMQNIVVNPYITVTAVFSVIGK